MKLSTVSLAIGLAVGSVSAFAAGGPLDVSSGSAGFASTPGAGSFSEVFTFSLATPSTLTGAISSVVNGGQNIDFGTITLAGPAGSFSFAKILSDPFELWTISTGALSAGSYSLTLTGTNSPAIATYSGNIALAPVPEPEAYAMMLAGLGVIGFVAIRRRSDKA
jgi:hypothetical protein